MEHIPLRVRSILLVIFIILGAAAAITIIISSAYGIGLLVYIAIPPLNVVFDPPQPARYVTVTIMVGGVATIAIILICGSLYCFGLALISLYGYSEGVCKRHEKYSVVNDDQEVMIDELK